MLAATLAVTAAVASWTALDTITGGTTSGRFGGRLAMNSAGDRFVTYTIDTTHGPSEDGSAIHPAVYRYNGSAFVVEHSMWTPYASTTRTYTLDAGVAMSGDGAVVAVGNGIDGVTVYTKNEAAGRWDPLWNLNATSSVEYGRSIALPAVGLSVAVDAAASRRPAVVGAPGEDSTGDDDLPTDRGTLSTYQLALGGADTLLQSTQTLTAHSLGIDVSYAWGVGDAAKFLATAFTTSPANAAVGIVYSSTDGGSTVVPSSSFSKTCSSESVGVPGSISGDGLYVAIGCPAGNATATAGMVQVFWYDGSDYTANVSFAGNAVDAAGFGSSVSLNEDGTLLAIGTDGTGSADTVDYVQVWERVASTWALRRSPVGGEVAKIRGSSLETSSNAYNIQAVLSADGAKLAVGIPGVGAGEGDSYGSGRITVYEWTTPAPTAAPTLGSDEPSSNKKHTDAVLGGAIGGAVGGVLLLGGVAYLVHTRMAISSGRYSAMVGKGGL